MNEIPDLDWPVKYQRLQADFDQLLILRNEWSARATQRLERINELEAQLKNLQLDLDVVEEYKTKLQTLEEENKKLAQQVERARELLKTYNVSFLALLKVSEREADASYLTHQQRKILAEVRFMILQGLGISLEGQQKKEAGDTEIDPIPFNFTRPVYDEF